MSGLFIRGGTVVTVNERNEVIEGGAVLIKGDRIEAVGSASDLEGAARGARVIEASGKAVLPGLINCHTHIASNVLLRGLLDDVHLFQWLDVLFKVKRHFEEEDMYYANLVGMAEMIKSGTTCYNEFFDAYPVTPAVRAINDLPIRAAFGWGLADGGVYAETARSSWENLRHFRDIVREHHGSCNGRLSVVIAPHAIYTCSPELLRESKQVANELKLMVHIHIAEGPNEQEYALKQYDTSPVRFLHGLGFLGPEVLLAHSVRVDDEEVQIIADAGARVAHCPISNAKLACGTAPVPVMLERGVRVGLATDGPASNNSLDMFAEMKFAAVVHKMVTGDPTVMPAERVLRLATIESAAAMGMEREIGSIEPGKKADIIIVDLNEPHFKPVSKVIAALVYAGTGASVDTVIIDGQVVMEGRKLLFIDEGAVLSELQRHTEALIARSLS